jgi:hypothetical protein
MFSKGNQEKQESKSKNNPQVDDLMIPNPKINDTKSSLSSQAESAIEQPQLVKLVEKISGILSPYFIVIVGLYLSDNNFLFGSILIIIGILSLLKISYADIWQWIQQIKGIFTDKNN